MNIIAGRLRGRRLVAPPGLATRPTAQRLRQALFDILMHAPWGGHSLFEGACIADLFAGTGALGLEALSRGAASAEFFEQDRAAIAALRANIAACGAARSTQVHVGDARRPPAGPPARMVFLDPPYRQGLVEATLAGMDQAGRLRRDSVIIVEAASDEPTPLPTVLVERIHGAGRIIIGHHV